MYTSCAAKMHALPHGHVDVERLASAVSTEVVEHVLPGLTPSSVWLGRTITSVFEHHVNIVGVKRSVSLTGFKTGHLRVP